MSKQAVWILMSCTSCIYFMMMLHHSNAQNTTVSSSQEGNATMTSQTERMNSTTGMTGINTTVGFTTEMPQMNTTSHVTGVTSTTVQMSNNYTVGNMTQSSSAPQDNTTTQTYHSTMSMNMTTMSPQNTTDNMTLTDMSTRASNMTTQMPSNMTQNINMTTQMPYNMTQNVTMEMTLNITTEVPMTMTMEPTNATTMSPPFDGPVVNTTYGKVGGKYVHMMLGNEMSGDAMNVTGEEYLGIPYAKPPLGDLRFSKPMTQDKWEGIRNATQRAPQCLQPVPPNMVENGTIDETLEFSEDCLYLNIFVPRGVEMLRSENMTLPIMVYISGGFTFLTALDSVYDGIILANNHPPKIVITFSYRVGALGFLVLDKSPFTGNYGLWDQAMVLKWVQENAQYFGGDPNRVTLFGESSGGASVDFLKMLPLSEATFKSGISMSGVGLSPWAMSRNKKLNMDAGHDLAESLGCLGHDKNKTACLLNVNASDIIANQQNPRLQLSYHIPVMDGPFNNTNSAELPRSIIYGTNTGDYSNFAANRIQVGDPPKYSMDKFKVIMSYLFEDYYGIKNNSFLDTLVNMCLFQYMNVPDSSQSEILSKATLISSDMLMTAPMLKTLMESPPNITYAFLFDYKRESVLMSSTRLLHQDTSYFIFGGPLKEGNSTQDMNVSKHIMSLFGDFAELGAPPASWLSFDQNDNQNYMLLSTMPSMQSYKVPPGRQRQLAFWVDQVPELIATVQAAQMSCPSTPQCELDKQACKMYYADALGVELTPSQTAGVMWGMTAAAILFFLFTVILGILLCKEMRKRGDTTRITTSKYTLQQYDNMGYTNDVNR